MKSSVLLDYSVTELTFWIERVEFFIMTLSTVLVYIESNGKHYSLGSCLIDLRMLLFLEISLQHLSLSDCNVTFLPKELAIESENVVADESSDLADRANSDALNDVSRSVGQPDHYHSTHWSHSPVLVTQQSAVMAPITTTGVIAMATAQVDRPQSSGFSDGAYYSGFAKQRPLQEIVSSLQGSYNFLQESQIDVDGKYCEEHLVCVGKLHYNQVLF